MVFWSGVYSSKSCSGFKGDVNFLKKIPKKDIPSLSNRMSMLIPFMMVRPIQKGREVFRTLKNYIDMFIPGGFREVQNLYFSRYDGQAVTFREFLSAANEVLTRSGSDLALFERWFHQPGTPVIQVNMKYDANEKEVELIMEQSCPHPRTGKEQEPFQIPFSLELIGKNGTIIHPKISFVLEDERTYLKLACF